MATKKKDVAKISKGGMPAEMLDELTADSAQYEEKLGKDDVSIPFLGILQSLSPQCIDGDGAYMEDARPGMFLNNVSMTLYEGKQEGVLILPLKYNSSYIEWIPRSAGGGFVKEYSIAEGSTINTQLNDINHDIITEDSPLGTPGNQLSLTHTHFVFIVDPKTSSFEPAVISMTATQVKYSKKWNMVISTAKLPTNPPRKAPRFFNLYRATTNLEKNDQGSWYTWNIVKDKTVIEQDASMELYREAKLFVDSINTGDNKADYSKMDTGSGNTDVDPQAGDDEIPF